MKKLSLLLLIPFFMLLSCSDDNSENPDNKSPILSLTNEQIAGTYTLSKAINKDGKAIEYGCDFSKVYYDFKTSGEAAYNRCSTEYARTWKREKNNIIIFGDGLTGDGHSYTLQMNQNNSNLEIVLNSNTETVIYSRN